MQAQAQPAPRETPIRKLIHTFVGLGALALIGGAILFILSQVGVIGYDRDGSAIGVARDAVRSRLVSPGSAKFPFGSTKIAARTADGQFRIAFVVADSQNKFGAMLRSESLVLLWDRNGSTEAVHTEVFEKSPTVRDVRKLSEEVGKDWAIEEWLR